MGFVDLCELRRIHRPVGDRVQLRSPIVGKNRAIQVAAPFLNESFCVGRVSIQVIEFVDAMQILKCLFL